MKIHSILTIMFLGILFTSCSKQQARKPVSQTSGTFMKESIERNKKLIAEEEQLIESIISKDTLDYIASSKGYWYKYDIKTDNDTIFPKRGDIVYFNYEIKDLQNKLIYTKEELKPQEYFVDKENIMMGLRDGIKLMKKGETITFLFPSHMAYGYHGDNEKIGSNEPLICTVTLNDIKKEKQKNEETN
ncbi:gliding motility-associated peptidyl-prolyl isomerase GldI [Flavobacterium sp.]|uniref:gliding motility-associated peptidyl-prolyl isomerase GldI n=1 Tax=Flavobacterium sp. TaxID=239 RepID=UPI003D27DE29